MGNTLANALKDEYKILETQPACHAHLKAPIPGIGLTDAWQKIDLNTTDFFIDALGGFTFDEINKRFIWDAADALNMDIIPVFVGDSGIEVTSGAGVSVAFGLFVNGNLILETERGIDALNKIQSLGANDYIIDDTTKLPIIEQGGYVEFFIRAGTSETPTISIDYFYITLFGR